MANEFLKKLANAGIPELARMPHALDPERGFRVRSEFTFYEYRDVANPASPVRWLADLVLGLVGARWMIRNEAQELSHQAARNQQHSRAERRSQPDSGEPREVRS